MDTRNFTVGRDAACADVVPDDTTQLDTVSRCHLTVQPKPDGRHYRIEDQRSANGTYAMENGAWVQVDKAVVSATTPLRLGMLETTVERLLAQRRAAAPAATATPPPLPRGGRIYRDPTTGEIIHGS